MVGVWRRLPMAPRTQTHGRQITDRTVRGPAKNKLSGDFYFTSWRMDSVDRPEYDQLQNRQYHNLGGSTESVCLNLGAPQR